MQRSPWHQSLERESKPLAREITIVPHFPANGLMECLEHVMLTGKIIILTTDFSIQPFLSFWVFSWAQKWKLLVFVLQKSLPHLRNNYRFCFCCNCVPVIRIAAFLKLQAWNKVTDLPLLIAWKNSDVRGDWHLLLLISCTWGTWFLLSKFELQ